MKPAQRGALPEIDLLAPLAPPPADLARAIGLVDGPADWWEGFGAGLRCWCGPTLGWLRLGDLLGRGESGAPVGGITLHRGRATLGLVWDLGPAPMRPKAREQGENIAAAGKLEDELEETWKAARSATDETLGSP